MNKKLYALLIAFSISTAPICASASSFLSGYFGGVGTILFIMGAKKIKHAKTYLKITGANPTVNAADNESPMVMHNWTSDYLEGAGILSASFLALILASSMYSAA